MLIRLRRTAAVLSTVLLLAACGDSGGTADDNGSSPSASASTGALDEVTFSGEVGTGLTAEWHDKVAKPSSTTVTTLVAGDGDEVAEGDTVSAYLWAGNGSTQKDVYNDYDNGAPVSIPVNESLTGVFRKLIEGQTYGSRVAAVTTPTELFGDAVANNPLGVGEDDTVVIVADLVEKAAVAPEPTDADVHDVPADQMPAIVEKDGKPTGLDFSGIEEPALDTPVQRVVLEEGDGAKVKASDTVEVNYLGSTFDADAPFDESFSGEPLSSPLAGLIKGWTIGLTDVKVGSRVLIQIPPAFGYGAEGSGDIEGNATLWFVIDVLKAS